MHCIEKMCWSLSPIRLSSRVFLKIEVVIEVTYQLGTPVRFSIRRVYELGIGKEVRLNRSLVIISVFTWLNFKLILFI